MLAFGVGEPYNFPLNHGTLKVALYVLHMFIEVPKGLRMKSPLLQGCSGLALVRRDRRMGVLHISWRRVHEEEEAVKDKPLRKKIPPPNLPMSC